MNVLITCDKYKSSLSAHVVCQSIAQGLLQSNADLHVQTHPMADGGDGTIAVLFEHLDLKTISVKTFDPYHRKIEANYASDGLTAYIELASASGIARLNPDEYNPMVTTTIGTGNLIRDAIDQGHQHIVLALGGSCTTDAGLGIAHAVGFQYYNSNGESMIPMGANLSQIDRIIVPEKPLPTSFKILCDVDNPLYGPTGAAHIFGPQKGATEEDVIVLDTGLRHIAALIKKVNGIDIQSFKGGGAAGGIAAGLCGLLDAEIMSGFSYISEASGLEEKIAWADLVITGEGRLDEQSFGGKVVGQLISMCKASQTPIIAIVGKNGLEKNDLFGKEFLDILSISDRAKNLEDAMSHASGYLIKIGSEINLDMLLDERSQY